MTPEAKERILETLRVADDLTEERHHSASWRLADAIRDLMEEVGRLGKGEAEASPQPAPERIWIDLEAVAEDDEGAHCTYDSENTHHEYVRADLASQPAPAAGWRIVPLEWHEHCELWEAASNPFGEYWIDGYEGRYGLRLGPGAVKATEERYLTLDAAKAAAQQDFAARIMSCLKPAPDAYAAGAEAMRDPGHCHSCGVYFDGLDDDGQCEECAPSACLPPAPDAYAAGAEAMRRAAVEAVRSEIDAAKASPLYRTDDAAVANAIWGSEVAIDAIAALPLPDRATGALSDGLMPPKDEGGGVRAPVSPDPEAERVAEETSEVVLSALAHSTLEPNACPFCRERVEVRDDTPTIGGWFIDHYCPVLDCNIFIDEQESREALVRRWNIRSISPSTTEAPAMPEAERVAEAARAYCEALCSYVDRFGDKRDMEPDLLRAEDALRAAVHRHKRAALAHPTEVSPHE